MEEKIENRIYIYLNLISQLIILTFITRSFYCTYVLLTKTDFNNGFGIFWLSLDLITLFLLFAGLRKYTLIRIKDPKYFMTNVDFTYNWTKYIWTKYEVSDDENNQKGIHGIYISLFLLIITGAANISDYGFFPEFHKESLDFISRIGTLTNVFIFWFLFSHSRANLRHKEQFPLFYLNEKNHTTSYSEFAYKNECNEITIYNDLYLQLVNEFLIDREINRGEMCKITILNPNKNEVGVYTSNGNLLLTTIESDSLIHLITEENTGKKFNAQIINYYKKGGRVIIRFWIKHLNQRDN